MRVPAKPISLDEALEMTRTGDVWLYRGRAVADRAIQISTNSPVNHVGMTVALDDLPPLMWHAELGRSLPDLWAGGHHRGVQLHDLRAAVMVWTTRYGQRAWLRQLDHPATRQAEEEVLRTIARLDGTPFPSTARLATRWWGSPDPPPAKLVRPRPVLERRRPRPAPRCPTRRRDRHPRPARTTAGTPPTTRTPAVTQQPPTSNPLRPAPSR